MTGAAPPAPPAGTGAELLRDGTRRLLAAGVPDAALDAEWLLAEVLGTDRGGLFARRADPVPEGAAARYDALLARRETREPLQHVLGHQEFWGRRFVSDARALVPRPETEGLVEAALDALDAGAELFVADLGCGSGCILISLLLERPAWRGRALDRSAAALDQARENARLHGVEDRVDWARDDLDAAPGPWRRTCDAVVCNPPYVAQDEWERLEPEVRDFDPYAALVPGPTGFEAYRALFPAAAALLRPGGFLAVELGDGQSAPVSELARRAGFRAVRLRDDLRRVPRVLTARR